MSRNCYIVKTACIKIGFVKIDRSAVGVFGEGEFPNAVEALTEIALACKAAMVGMCGDTIYFKNFGICEPFE